jgi:hypothetical protein
VADRNYDHERVRVIRELIAEAESETPHTTDDAMAQQGAVLYLRSKLADAGKVILDGD